MRGRGLDLLTPAFPVFAAAALSGFLLAFAACQDMPRRREGPSQELEVTVLSDALTLLTRGGDRVAGYVGEYTLDFEKHRVFMALEIQKYVKGERLAVKGNLLEDTVRAAVRAGEAETDLRVFRVTRAGPAPVPPIPDIKETEAAS